MYVYNKFDLVPEGSTEDQSSLLKEIVIWNPHFLLLQCVLELAFQHHDQGDKHSKVG